MPQPTQQENNRLLKLQQSRKKKKSLSKKVEKIKEAINILSFRKKISKHWMILAWAVFFDILGLIPYTAIVFNFIWGGMLYLKFGGKKISKTAYTIGLGSIADFFIGILPVCIGATLIKIYTE